VCSRSLVDQTAPHHCCTSGTCATIRQTGSIDISCDVITGECLNVVTYITLSHSQQEFYNIALARKVTHCVGVAESDLWIYYLLEYLAEVMRLKCDDQSLLHVMYCVNFLQFRSILT